MLKLSMKEVQPQCQHLGHGSLLPPSVIVNADIYIGFSLLIDRLPRFA